MMARPGPVANTAEGLWARAPRLWLSVPVRSLGLRGIHINIGDSSILQLQAKTTPLYIHLSSYQAFWPCAVLGPGEVEGI